MFERLIRLSYILTLLSPLPLIPPAFYLLGRHYVYTPKSTTRATTEPRYIVMTPSNPTKLCKTTHENERTHIIIPFKKQKRPLTSHTSLSLQKRTRPPLFHLLVVPRIKIFALHAPRRDL
jgi:hypothetical protein